MAKDITISDKDLIGSVVSESEKIQTPAQDTSNKNEKAPKLPPKERKPSFLDKLQPWQKILIVSILAMVILGATGFIMYLYVIKQSTSPSKILTLSNNYVEAADYTKSSPLSALSQPELPRTEVSPLNGLLFTKSEMTDLKKKRPVAVMINNHVKARPQSGLSSADIIYESVVESGITRYMAIFWSNGPNKVGPIRSARQYYLEWLSPLDPVYIHDGCAQTDDPRTNACGNIYSYGIKDILTHGAWRVNDGIRFAPHNEYSSIVSAWDYAKTLGWDTFPSTTPSLKFKTDATPEKRGAKSHIKIRFRTDLPNGGLYDSEFIYDTSSNAYLHKIGGQADLDLETGKQVAAKTIVVQEVSMQSAYDGFARVIITTTGEGKATILQDGKLVTGKWKKSSRTDRTKYYDTEGKELELNRGLLWVIALPREYGDFDIIEQ